MLRFMEVYSFIMIIVSLAYCLYNLCNNGSLQLLFFGFLFFVYYIVMVYALEVIEHEYQKRKKSISLM